MQSPKRSVEDILADVAAGRLTEEQGAAEIRANEWIEKGLHRRKNGLLISFVVFTILGCTFFSIGAAFAIYSYSVSDNAERTDGEVIRLVGAGKGGTKPVVRYVVNGQPFEIMGSISTSPPAYTVGEKVPVFYKRDNPADGHIDSFAERWLFPVIFGGIGALLLVVAIILWIVRRMRRPAFAADEQTAYPG